MIDLPPGEWPDVSEDDPDVLLAARAIAEHGVGRPWGDFLPTNAYDIDHGDLIEYGRAAVAALRAKVATRQPDDDEAPETICVDGTWYDRRDTVDALTRLLANARATIEADIRELGLLRQDNLRLVDSLACYQRLSNG